MPNERGALTIELKFNVFTFAHSARFCGRPCAGQLPHFAHIHEIMRLDPDSGSISRRPALYGEQVCPAEKCPWQTIKTSGAPKWVFAKP